MLTDSLKKLLYNHFDFKLKDLFSESLPVGFYEKFLIGSIKCQNESSFEQVCNVYSLIRFTQVVSFVAKQSGQSYINEVYGLNSLIDLFAQKPLKEMGISLSITTNGFSVQNSTKGSLVSFEMRIKVPNNLSTNLLSYQIGKQVSSCISTDILN
jgi:hypothetical protein